MYGVTDAVKNQFAVARLPEFRVTVTTVNALPFYPMELSIPGRLMNDAHVAGPSYKTSRTYARWAGFKRVSNADHHYPGSAECFVEMGDAFAEAIVSCTGPLHDEMTS